jgi:hypothetical protein
MIQTPHLAGVRLPEWRFIVPNLATKTTRQSIPESGTLIASDYLNPIHSRQNGSG